MKKFIIYFLSLLLISFFIFIAYHTQSECDENILVVGTSADYQPYAFIDTKTDEVVGFDIDVASEIATRMGKQVAIKDTPFNMLIFDLFSGDVDIIAAGLTPTARKAKKVNFTQVYFDKDPLIALTKPGVMNITSVQDLIGKKVVVNTGYTADMYLTEQELDCEIVRLKSPAESLMALQSGSVDVFVSARSSLNPFLEQKNNADQFAMFLLPDTGDDYAIAIKKGNDKLLTSVNNAINMMRKDGTLDKLKKKWKLS